MTWRQEGWILIQIKYKNLSRLDFVNILDLEI